MVPNAQGVVVLTRVTVSWSPLAVASFAMLVEIHSTERTSFASILISPSNAE